MEVMMVVIVGPEGDGIGDSNDDTGVGVDVTSYDDGTTDREGGIG